MDAVSACAALPTGDGTAADMPLRDAVFRDLGRVAYAPVWRAMQGFTDARGVIEVQAPQGAAFSVVAESDGHVALWRP